MQVKKKGLIGVLLLLLSVLVTLNVFAAGKVVVIPLNSCRDPDLLPENIIWGVNICGVIGTANSPTVISAGGRIWMNRNLGASQVANSSTDTLAYGDLYQTKPTELAVSTRTGMT